MRHIHLAPLAAAVLLATLASPAQAVELRITVENLAPANSVALAPFRFGFGNGTFDAFNEGASAFLLGQPDISQAPIVTVAEGGSGSTWFPAFAAAEPTANLGSVLGPTGGPFVPGAVSSATFQIDPSNRYLTFGAMVVPSNDHFIGNDDPLEYEVFDANGNLVLGSITQTIAEVWDAGSETENPANAAFLVGGVNAQRENENLPVRFDFAGFSTFSGLTTAAGYVFDPSTLTASTPLVRITFEVIPEPSSLALGGLACVGAGARRRRAV